MSSDDWYRRTTWTDTDRAEFHARLKRSRGAFHKAQYLRIQAHHLAKANLTQGAVELLDQLIADFPDPSQLAQAHLQYAECMLASDRVDDAVVAYRRAFDAEQAFSGTLPTLTVTLPAEPQVTTPTVVIHEVLKPRRALATIVRQFAALKRALTPDWWSTHGLRRAQTESCSTISSMNGGTDTGQSPSRSRPASWRVMRTPRSRSRG